MSASAPTAGTGSLTFLVDAFGTRASPLRVFADARIGRLYEVIQSEQHTVPTAATLLWQAVLRTPGFARALVEAGYNGRPSDQSFSVGYGAPPPRRNWPPDCLVVPHSEYDTFSLVVFDPGRGSQEPVSFPVFPIAEEVARAVEEVRFRLQRLRPQQAGPLAYALDPGLIAGLAEQGPLNVVLIRTPETEPSSAPTPAEAVIIANGQSASAGVLARRQGGNRIGLTTARHLFAEAGLGPVPGVTQASVRGVLALVDAADLSSDCAFLLPDDPGTDFATLLPCRSVAGILSGMTPRQNETMSFEGSHSGPQQTIVRGWSPELPWVLQDMQMRVVTDRVTAGGDSGAALVDGDGHVCGFAYRTTKWGVKPEISNWIWADSAMQALGLTLYP
ncbi:hypothetical protein C8P66_13816 [Humitalea rosea]|uniref:Trypsin-like peptidase n=1 Tax=Humitalea rosea TaxID=990373 RepID=A0A2W7HWR7_9PROT|nr:trypsin-like peptidase domain-containing protein [Humitalea rosea]PZW37984.1 hypothetical protein C8P66_13816 [Humitalea rosea]